MNCYEILFLIRQDTSSAKLEEITNKLITSIQDDEGILEKNEDWGTREIAYEMRKQQKAHYVFLGVKMKGSTVTALSKRIKQFEQIIRPLILKVKSIDSEPSYLLRDVNTSSVTA